ncbi:MAG: ferritin-like domain-containing protein [Pseudonocardiaceae bacterium]
MLRIERHPAAERRMAAADTGIVRDFLDPYLELLRLLREAAEIEHSLMVQYLFAAFSVRPVYRNQLAGSGFGGDSRTLTGVAIQEMDHLNSVNELLVALGATPCLIRQDFPYEPEIYPFPFELERLSPVSVAKYTWAEAPATALVDDGGDGTPSLLDRLRAVLGEKLRPNHLGSIYGTMIERLEDVAADPPPRFPDPATWTQRLSDIKDEGESDHFEFFRSVFDGEHSAFAAVPNVWALDPADPRYPFAAVPANPSAFPTGDAGDPRRIADDSVRRLAWLGDLHYWLVLMLLDLSYRHNAATSSFAVQHMTGGLRVIGFALSDMGHGPAFDVLSMGYAPGLDRAGSIEVVRRLAKEAATHADELAAEGLLPPDYATDLNPSTITLLAGL